MAAGWLDHEVSLELSGSPHQPAAILEVSTGVICSQITATDGLKSGKLRRYLRLDRPGPTPLSLELAVRSLEYLAWGRA